MTGEKKMDFPPLSFPAMVYPPESWLEWVFFRLPGLIEIGVLLEKRRMKPVVEYIEKQLSSRPSDLSFLWGNNTSRAKMASLIVETAHICWSQRCFVPDDPFIIVVWSYT